MIRESNDFEISDTAADGTLVGFNMHDIKAGHRQSLPNPSLVNDRGQNKGDQNTLLYSKSFKAR